jgi:RNA polymerase-binding transcription factor DksA
MNTAHFQKRLEEEKARLESEMGSVGRKNPAVPGDWEAVPSETGQEPDEADQADVFVSADTNAAILADLEARYDTVLEALKRIEAGAYGVCEECGKGIEEDRLGADPAATTCKDHR